MIKRLCNFVWIMFALSMACSCGRIDTRLNSPENAPDLSESLQVAMGGYLAFDSVPKVHELIPPPPQTGSAAFAYDEEVSKKNLALRGTSRWRLATEDANQGVEAFSCVLNVPLSKENTPRLYMLLRRVRSDVGFATIRAKNKFKRPRPFMVNNEAICTPESEEGLRRNGAYPSGHTSGGWAYALILAEIAPEYADAILYRGRAYGQSRVVCNVHWQSDVNEGRFTGAVIVSRLHADPEFRADLEAARAELIEVRQKNLKPLRDCIAEAEALSY